MQNLCFVEGRGAGVTKPLSVGQVSLAPLQLLGQQFLLGDIHCAPEKPFEDFVFNNGNTDAADVSQFAVGSKNSLLHIAAAPFRMHSSYGPSHEVPVWPMNGR